MLENKAPEKNPTEHIEEDEDEGPPPKTIPPSQPKPPGSTEIPPATPAPDPPKVAEPKPLETVLHMPSPQEEEQRKPPHLKTPPYVHHFDTYSLVKDLTKSGFTEDQSITTMKAVRGILGDNISLARRSLVSKSNVENETYLFRAACSELRTEIGNMRKGQMERMRTERNQLQHEVDILGQKMGQETTHLKDDLKGLFDDRKMAVRQEQRVKETMVFIATNGGRSVANSRTDSRARLQNYHRAQLGRAQRSRRSEMGSHASRRHGHWCISVHAVRGASIYELRQPSTTGTKEAGREETASG